MRMLFTPHFLPAFFLFGTLAAGSAASGAQELELGTSPREYRGHFQVFTGDGEPASLADIVQAMAGAEAVLVGEIHTDPVGHWIETELVREALALTGVGEETGVRRPFALSLEMFERDVQGIVDEYLQGLITEEHFKASARPWEHYDTDYRPMVEMAKEAGVPVLAANAPRRYVNRVTRLGPSSLMDLPSRARIFLPPLPYPPPTDAYRAEWTTLMSEMVMEPQCPVPEGEGMEGKGAGGGEEGKSGPPAEEVPEEHAEVKAPHTPPAGMPPHGGDFMENGLQAQTLWDASMAYAVTTFLDRHPGSLVLHMVGGFHVANFTGIPEKVEFYRPGTRILVISMELAEDIAAFDPEEHGGLGDFVILTDESLDLNYERNCVDDGR